MKPIRLSIALLTAWMLAMALGSCNKSNPDPVPPACPPDPKPVVKTEGPVRFEFGVTDLDGNPKNCFRKGEPFRVYLYIINQGETRLWWNNAAPESYLTPELFIVDQDAPPIIKWSNSAQCRGPYGHVIAAFDSLIFDTPRSFELPYLQSLAPVPYLEYLKRRRCRVPEWRVIEGNLEKLPVGRYRIRLRIALLLGEPKPGYSPIPSGDEKLLPLQSYAFEGELPLVVQ
ncbi:hypothetical protein [Rhodoflexus caldus]|uniref:hypothetical protein n=1 Tax=Rhodoflexus caldus TaxID=2891236 RepID=UPI002029EF8E|nr:hypothetical protein [Rhodoflexus caldus]